MRHMIPFANSALTVDEQGTVYENELPLKRFRGEDNRWKVKICWFNGYRDYDVGVLVAWAFKIQGVVSIPAYYIPRISVMFADGNVDNFESNNLVWKFPKERLLYVENPDFAYIPGFSKYVINREGVLLNAKFGGKEIKPHRSSRYKKFKLSSDMNELVTIGRHRLVVLAWKDYPANVNELVVNHINGIPGDDVLTNLELITRAKNNQHASITGLTRKGRAILVRTVVDNTVTEYSGTTAYAREMGINRSTVKYRIDSPNQPVYPPGVQLKYKYDPTPWREVNPDELEDLKLNQWEACPVYVRDIYTGKVVRYPSIQKAGNANGISVDAIHSQVKGISPRRPIKGLDFCLHDGPWRQYSCMELEMFKLSPKGKLNPCIVQDIISGKDYLLPTMRHVCNFTKITMNELYRSIDSDRLIAKRFYVKKYEL